MMHKSNEDCFYFLTSTCAKGSACVYRHSPLALTANVICPAWLHGNCHDPACPLRHNKTIQRPPLSNGISCFFETTPIGCLKPDCSFIHSRPRPHLKPSLPARPASMTLINKDVLKPTVAAGSSSVTSTLSKENVAESKTGGSSTPNSIATTEVLSTAARSSPTEKKSVVPRRVALLSESEPSKEKVDSTKTSGASGAKVSARSVITHSPSRKSDDTTTGQPRLVVSRNVVLAESVNSPSRTIVQSTPSTRVVLTSTSKLKRNETNADSSVDQEKKSKKFKSESQSTVDISISHTSSNRRLLTADDAASPKNETTTATGRLNRLPTSKRSSGNLSKSVSTPLIDQKISTGPRLSPADDRRTSRIERFKTKSISPPQSTSTAPISNGGAMSNASSTRNVITAPSLDRKRTAPASSVKDSPPPKRVSAPSKDSADRSPSVSSSSHSHSREKKDDRESAAKAKQVPDSSALSTKAVPSQLAASPRFVPHPIRPPSPLSSTSTQSQRQRQPPSVVIKRPLASVVVPVQKRTETTEHPQSGTTENIISSSKSTLPVESLNLEDENQLLKVNESSNFIDTFALIDEALLEADHLLELM